MSSAIARFLPPVSVSGGPANVNAAIISPAVSNRAVKVRMENRIWKSGNTLPDSV
jgi:hypothetical protein